MLLKVVHLQRKSDGLHNHSSLLTMFKAGKSKLLTITLNVAEI